MCMKKILTVCGYNNAWAFKGTDDKKITQLEAFVESRYRKIVDAFDKYQEMKPFEFLPEHRALKLGIKAEILLMEARMDGEKKNQRLTNQEAFQL